ncbi:hypothetical protein BDW42DRAFT_162020 [Aspergillus taichungensis]|uniref:Uncharacterized protein n=1 Tax=Aspergillus taichungensis TaxID=482145 RepID=A0A2J5I474_9EURO|nr:hypothetical protein BDW42DRAFT_162020 [Aspergillus taichungensis]
MLIRSITPLRKFLYERRQLHWLGEMTFLTKFASYTRDYEHPLDIDVYDKKTLVFSFCLCSTESHYLRVAR